VNLFFLQAEGSSIDAVFTHSGQAYTVKIDYVDDSVSVSSKISVMCKYVRRELRGLTESDREIFLNALAIVYSTGLDEGKEIYGDGFKNHEYFTIKHVGVNRCNPFHGSTTFLTSHAAFTLEMETSMQLIEPSVTVPYWDYTYENIHYGSAWDESEVFSDDWFGTTEPDNTKHVLDTGRFAYTAIPSSFDRPVFNSYGRITSQINNDPSKYLGRSHSICGVPTTKPLPDCNAVLGCFKTTSLNDLHICLEGDVHSYFHLMIGGAWECQYSAKTIQEAIPKMNQTTTFILYNSQNVWGLLHLYSVIICPDFCTEDTPFSECTCTSPKIDEMIKDGTLTSEVINEYLIETEIAYWLDVFLDNINVDYENDLITFDGLTTEENEEYLKWILLFSTHPGLTGGMGTAGAPNDPTFWPIHPTFDRLFTFIRMAPAFADFNFTWPSDGSCYGNGYYDLLPFRNLLNEDASHDYSNQQLFVLFDPANPELPYVYDSFHWKNCADSVNQEDKFMQEIIRQTKGILPPIKEPSSLSPEKIH